MVSVTIEVPVSIDEAEVAVMVSMEPVMVVVVVVVLPPVRVIVEMNVSVGAPEGVVCPRAGEVTAARPATRAMKTVGALRISVFLLVREEEKVRRILCGIESDLQLKLSKT